MEFESLSARSDPTRMTHETRVMSRVESILGPRKFSSQPAGLARTDMTRGSTLKILMQSLISYRTVVCGLSAMGADGYGHFYSGLEAF